MRLDFLQSHAWQVSIGRFVVLLAVALLVGWLIGLPHHAVTAALFGYAVWSLASLYRVQTWLRSRRRAPPPAEWGVWSDVSEFVYLKMRAERSRKRRLVNLLRAFREAAAALPDGVLVLTRGRGILWFNQSAARLLGLARGRDRGALVDDFLPAQARAWLDQDPPLEPLMDVPAPNDDATRLSLRLIPYSKDQILLVVRDITTLTRLEQVRRDFVANVSHELRTPLTVLHGYLDMLEPEEAPQWAPMLEDLRSQSKRMAQIVEDLLTLSRLEAQQDIPDERVAMRPMLSTLKREAEALGHRQHEVVAKLTCTHDLRGSMQYLHSAFSNLVTNAVRYTAAGGRIEIRWEEDAGGARFVVEDTGYGIPAEQLPRITERFYRVSTSRSRATGGTGLGLSIVKHVLNLHQARLEIDSEVGVGSSFACVFGASRLFAGGTRLPAAVVVEDGAHGGRCGARSSDMIKLHDPSLYINRELSQLEFQFRVLAQARDTTVPLLERLRFLCISCTNLDEFFEIRVAALRQQVQLGGSLPGADGFSAGESLARVRTRAQELIAEQYLLWNKTLRPALKKAGITLLTREEWNPKQRKWLKEYFFSDITPVLSPLGLDPAHPFPRILNKSLNIAVTLKGKDAFGREGHMAIVRAPRSLPRIIRLPPDLDDDSASQEFVFLSAVLHEFVDQLFPGMHVKGTYQFRVTRNSELMVDEDEVENLAHALKDELRGRGFAQAVRLEVAETCPKTVLKDLMANFELTELDVYRCNGPVNLNRVIAVYDMVDRPDLKYPPFQPRIQSAISSAPSVIEAIKRGDILMHHPYDSFSTVLDLVEQASRDPNVLAIKQTFYRTGADSPIVSCLVEAARAGKDVTVVIELRARFEEEANITVANRLQEAGVQVVYGVVGFKTHAKMLLIVRREGAKLKRYVHLSTGNYHAGTAKAYTDIGLLTCDPVIGEDVHRCLQQLPGLGPVIKLKRLLQAPFTLHKAVLSKIARETAHAKAGQPARIAAKINHLNEPVVIVALYEASRAGVKIDLIVRGTCALKPGIAGVSENIRVVSVVGRFLEHSRVYYFENSGTPEIYCSSADWLERNLLRRVETCFPILDPDLAARVYEEQIENYLADNTLAWRLLGEGTYERLTPGEAPPHSAQQTLLTKLCG